VSATAYAVLVWPTIAGLDAANVVIRLALVFSAAVAAAVVGEGRAARAHTGVGPHDGRART
jgi:hypothetical protein